MSLRDIVNVQITRQTSAVSQKGFGILMFASTHTVFAERVRYYSELSQLQDDGFATADAAYLAASVVFGQSPRPVELAIGRRDAADTSWGDALTAIANENDDFYAVAIDSRVQAEVLEAAAWAEANERLFGTSSDDTDVKAAATENDTDVAAALSELGYIRTFGIYHEDAATSYPECAWFGRQLPTDPGSSTWKFKELVGIAVSNLTDTETRNINAKGFNSYQLIAGARITAEGIVVGGEFIDIVRGIDWLRARITEGIYSRLVNLPKIPHTDPGYGVIEAQIRLWLTRGVAVGLVAADPEFTVTMPLAADVPFNEKAARNLPAVKFLFTLQGAIHAVNPINGTATL